MNNSVSRPASDEAANNKNVIGEWIAPITAWLAGIATLLAVLTVLLGPAE